MKRRCFRVSLWGGSEQCPNPQHSKPFCTLVKQPWTLFFFLLATQSQKNPSKLRQMRSPVKTREGEQHQLSQLIQEQEEPASWPGVFWSEEGGVRCSPAAGLCIFWGHLSCTQMSPALLDQAQKEGKQQVLPWMGAASHLLAHMSCVNAFPHSVPSSHQQQAISKASFSRMSNWWTKIRC